MNNLFNSAAKRIGSALIFVMLLVISTISLTSCFCSHEWTTIEIIQEPSCEVAGIRLQQCIECQKTRRNANILPTGHTYETWEVETEASCTEYGTQIAYCTICNHKGYRNIEPIGHQAGEPTVVRSPGCTEYGETAIKCLHCDEIMEQIQTEPHGHSYTWMTETESTCQTEGRKLGICVYNSEHTAAEIIPTKEHNYDMMSNSCMTCGAQQYPEIWSYEEIGTKEGTGVIIHMSYLGIDPSQLCTINIGSSMTYLRLVGEADKAYNNIKFVFSERNQDLRIDLVNTRLENTWDGNSPLVINGACNVTIGLYGSYCSVRGATGGRDGVAIVSGDGKNGAVAIDASRCALTFHVNTATAILQGGDGGIGGKGGFNMFVGGNGGDGGDGAYAVKADKIFVTAASGYSHNALSFVGGTGGAGGSGGDGIKKGNPGAAGQSSAATNVPVTYQ